MARLVRRKAAPYDRQFNCLPEMGRLGSWVAET